MVESVHFNQADERRWLVSIGGRFSMKSCYYLSRQAQTRGFRGGHLEPYGSFKSFLFLMDSIYRKNLYIGCVELERDVLA